MDRTERLLDLVALLLDAKKPLSWAELKDAFPDDYASGAAEACERKFERDKAELLELGIPLTWSAATDEVPEGYVVERDAYYLPEVALSADEWALLYSAGSAALASGAFPGSQDLAHALRKLGFFTEAPPAAAGVRLELDRVATSKELPAQLDTLWNAITHRKSVTLEYRSPRGQATTRRTVDGYGLALRRGVWNFVGYCQLRGAQRTFLVHRIRSLTVNTARPKSADYEVPATFSLDSAVASWPWQYQVHPPVAVEVALSGSLVPLAPSLLGAPARTEARGHVVTLAATDLDGLARTVLSLGVDAQVLSPKDAVTRVEAMAQRIVSSHRRPS